MVSLDCYTALTVQVTAKRVYAFQAPVQVAMEHWLRAISACMLFVRTRAGLADESGSHEPSHESQSPPSKPRVSFHLEANMEKHFSPADPVVSPEPSPPTSRSHRQRRHRSASRSKHQSESSLALVESSVSEQLAGCVDCAPLDCLFVVHAVAVVLVPWGT